MIIQAYQWKCSSWNPSSKARIAWDFATLLRIQDHPAGRSTKSSLFLKTMISDDFLSSGAFPNQKPYKQASQE